MNFAGRDECQPWPRTVEELDAEQERLARATMPTWPLPQLAPGEALPSVGASYVCFGRGGGGPGTAGDAGWAGAAWLGAGVLVGTALVRGAAAAAYDPGHLALREGQLHEAAVRGLPGLPEVLLVDATGRDHPRHAGLAVHLGARLGIPSVGVTNRLLVAAGEWPADTPGATAPFRLVGEIVGFWLRVRRGVRPLAVHAAWRTDAATALAIVRACLGTQRTPEPLRCARRLARAGLGRHPAEAAAQVPALRGGQR